MVPPPRAASAAGPWLIGAFLCSTQLQYGIAVAYSWREEGLRPTESQRNWNLELDDPLRDYLAGDPGCAKFCVLEPAPLFNDCSLHAYLETMAPMTTATTPTSQPEDRQLRRRTDERIYNWLV
jgi:hypothetical protein